MVGTLVTLKFHLSGDVPVWNNQDMEWGRSATLCVDYIRSNEICLVVKHDITFRGTHVLQVLTPRGNVGWVQYCNIKEVYL